MGKSSLHAPRRSPRGRHVEFVVGDTVEVAYLNGIEHGTLMYKVLDKPPPDTRWMVRYEDSPDLPPEIVCEKVFGRLISRAANDDNSTIISSRRGSYTPTLIDDGDAARKGCVSSHSPSNSDSENYFFKSKKRSTGNAQVTKKRSKPMVPLSIGERRQGGRQSIRTNDVVVSNSRTKKENKRRGRKRKVAALPSFRAPDVKKIKLLTGTLYIYKGINRKAVFVRRV